MAVVNGVVPGGEPGELELNRLANPSGGSPLLDPQSVTVEVPENFAHEEIQNVLWIRSSEVHGTALKEWEANESYLKSVVDDKEKRSADLMKQIVNLVWFFIVFQGVVLTVVSQLKSSNKPLCGIVWVPALLSSVAAVVTIGGISINFSTLHELQISIYNEKSWQRELAARATRLRALGRRFDFSRHTQDPRRREHNSWLSIGQFCIILLLFFFTGLFIMSYVVILCDSLVVHKWNQHLLL